MRIITSMYWKNIQPGIIAAQKAAFKALGFEIEQIEADQMRHGAWMDLRLANAPDDAVFLFLDIDALALNKAVIERAFAAAERGEVFGVAQTANHKSDPDYIYAAPSFMAFSKATWKKTGCISMLPTEVDDVGMAFSKAARAQGITVTTLMPSYTCLPLWRLADRGCSGIGTFYEGDVFHLFQSRYNEGYDYAFHMVSDAIICGRPVDYVALHAKMNAFSMKLSNRWAAVKRIPKRWQRSFKKRFVHMPKS